MFVPSLAENYIKQDRDIVRTTQRKDKKYYRDNCVGMFSLHVNNKGGIAYSDQSRYQFLREYSSGRQSEDTYKDYFSTDNPNQNQSAQRVTSVDGPGGYTETKEGKRKGYMNIFWKIIQFFILCFLTGLFCL